MKTRGFEVCKDFLEEEITLPHRSTKGSAGYDFCCAKEMVIPSFFKLALSFITHQKKEAIAPTLIPTGIKAYMPEDEVLSVLNRSSNPFKKGLVLANSVGIIDSDYYSNPENDGHIMFAFYNFFPFDITIQKGEKIGQGIFSKFLKADSDSAEQKRTGGFGSTGGKA